MKLPKHRSNIFLVERTVLYTPDAIPAFCVVGTFLTPEGADDFKGACIQDFVDRGIPEQCYSFRVGMSTYYDQ